jgi:UDP-2,3-diacylglucosamine pyrophosphatase LpxH
VNSPPNESLIILSDVHLGNDLNELTPAGFRRSSIVDTDLASLLGHYRSKPCEGTRWRLVIAGDFIDFVGMSLLSGDGGDLADVTDEEREHGLGNGAEHARLKLRAVAARHGVVFDALADFIGAGHAITIVHGNHDVEFHWDAVKEALRDLLVTRALARTASGEGVERREGEGEGEAPEAASASDFASRIEFAPWFYYVGGMAYVEHGHQYDTLCSTENVMAPLSPTNPRRTARSFSDVLLRWVVRPTRGVSEYGHENKGVIDYVRLGIGLGGGGIVHLFTRFVSAVVELFRMRRAHLSVAAARLREDHDRRITAMAEATRVGIERLRALAALQVPPVTRSAQKIMASVLLDRLALGLAAITVLVPLALAGRHHVWCWPVVGLVVASWIVLHRRLTAQRREWFGEKLDNNAVLVERAGHLARLFPAAFVVMGHTHTPAVVSVAEGAATYVNVGSWHEAEPTDADTFRAARTHLVIQPAASGPHAEFLAWGAEGPKKYSL